MEKRNALDFAVVGQGPMASRSQKEQVVAAWQRLRLRYRRSAGPKMFASYTPGN